jgi:predicted dehydrogenase
LQANCTRRLPADEEDQGIVTRQARIGIIGAGFWSAYFYLPYLRDAPDAICVGVVRRNEEALAALRRGFQLDVASTDVDELLAAGCDGIIVASGHSMHREHAIRALEAGCHVLIEKPMTVTLDDARATERAAHETGRTLTVAHGYNYQPMSTWAIDLVASGELGRPRHLTALMGSALVGLFSGTEGYGDVEVGGYRFSASPDTWAVADQGGGYLYGQTSHQLGLTLALVPAPPTSVFARLGRLQNGCDIDVSLSVEFADGSLATISGNGRMPWGVRTPMSIFLETDRAIMSLDFTNEVARAWADDDREHELPDPDSIDQGYAARGFPPTHEYPVPPGEGLYSCEGPARMLIDRCLDRPVIDRAPGELGVRAVAIMEAAVESARRGAAVETGLGA